jgi:PAS domain-containing protein
MNALALRPDLHQMIMNALLEHIAIIDRHGEIVMVNRAWRQFAQNNGGLPTAGLGVNYLELCDRTPGGNDSDCRKVAERLRAILAGKLRFFSLEYPCHSPLVKRFFQMHATPLPLEHGLPLGAVIAHADITQRKLLEMEREQLRLEIASTMRGPTEP